MSMIYSEEDLYGLEGTGVSSRKVDHGPRGEGLASCSRTRWFLYFNTRSKITGSLCQNPPVETLEALQQMLHCANMDELKSTLVEIDSSVRKKIKKETIAKRAFINWAKHDAEYNLAWESPVRQHIVHYEESGSSYAEGHHALQFLQAWANYLTRTTKLTPAQTANLNRTVVDYQSAMTFCGSL